MEKLAGTEMRIGLDFDNTIVCYDDIFHKIALEKGLIPSDHPKNKGSVRDYLREHGKEDVWTEMQGYVYGKRLREAAPFPGVFEFLRFCHDNGIFVSIVSHKTRYPYAGEKYDLHQAAFDWLEYQGYLDSEGTDLPKELVFLELTKLAKIKRIKSLNCTHFVDDLPELFAEPSFSKDVYPILFDPNDNNLCAHDLHRVSSWDDLIGFVRSETMGQDLHDKGTN